MKILSAVFLVLAGVDEDRIRGGSPEIRSAFAALGVGDPYYQGAEIWIEEKFTVILSKSEGLCEPAIKQIPDYWVNDYRILRLSLPKNPAEKKLLREQRILLVTEWPSGTSCGWRLLEPGADWESVEGMVKERSVGSCREALDSIAKLGASATTRKEIEASLGRARSYSECRVPDAGR